ncbi:MAG: aminomethyl-transferring glycine dehydrogenase subunit GcvPA [Spirochaetia bacterium]|nr:aminomethyl-transferring glycine dehydrogenase subunit GcvPA [Spirochaetia bacterium]
MAYIPSDTDSILNELKIKDTKELFKHIPDQLKFTSNVFFETLSESELIASAKNLANHNFSGLNFIGNGLYQHEIPVAVNHVSSNRNFVTSYTPYQPEVAQGTLQALFEYQSLMASLTSMDVVNASMYDGATALVEAIRMDLRQRKSSKKLILLSEGIHGYILDVIKTYFPENVKQDLNIEFQMIPLDEKTGSTKWDQIKNLSEARTVVVMNPTCWGSLEKDLGQLKKLNPDITLVYGVVEALSLTVLQAPADLGVDIVCGEAQSLGIPVGFGGPSLGFLAAKTEYMRQMPGRFVGKTNAINQKGDEVDSYVLTLSTREQHIRREKATSNICSNQSLMAVRAAAYMSYFGWHGMQEHILRCRDNANYFKENIVKKNYQLLYPDAEYFHEIPWLTKFDNSKDLKELIERGYSNQMAIGNLNQYKTSEKNTIVSYFSEVITKNDIDKLLAIL